MAARFIVLEKRLVPLRAKLYTHADVVPIANWPDEVMRICSILLVRNARSTASVFPIKFETIDDPELPEIAHGIVAHHDGFCQVASPAASDIRILPGHGSHPVILI